MNAWRSFVDYCRSPAFGEGGDIEGGRGSKRLCAALCAEFVGMLLFALFGGEARDQAAAYGNGLTLAVLIYATAHVSGGHLNPAVTLATMLSGHTGLRKGLAYIAAQLLGGIVGVLFQVALIPEAHVGMGNEGPGCFTHLGGRTIWKDQLFGWEVVMTFVLVAVVYATAVSKPGHGNIAPLAIGYTLFAAAFIGGPLTGAALNPARVLGPALIYNCYWNTAFIYIAAQLVGGAIAALVAMLLYGPGDEYNDDSLHEAQALQLASHGAAAKYERAGLVNMAASAGGAGRAQAPW